MLQHALLPAHCHTRKRHNVDGVQDGYGFRGVATRCSAQEYVVELYLGMVALLQSRHRTAFNAVIARQTMCRERAVVGDDGQLLFTNLAGCFATDFSREQTKSQCNLFVPSIVNSNPVPRNARACEYLDLCFSRRSLRPARVLSKVHPASSSQEREAIGPLTAATSKMMLYAWFSSTFRTCRRCSTSAQLARRSFRPEDVVLHKNA